MTNETSDLLQESERLKIKKDILDKLEKLDEDQIKDMFMQIAIENASLKGNVKEKDNKFLGFIYNGNAYGYTGIDSQILDLDPSLYEKTEDVLIRQERLDKARTIIDFLLRKTLVASEMKSDLCVLLPKQMAFLLPDDILDYEREKSGYLTQEQIDNFQSHLKKFVDKVKTYLFSKSIFNKNN